MARTLRYTGDVESGGYDPWDLYKARVGPFSDYAQVNDPDEYYRNVMDVDPVYSSHMGARDALLPYSHPASEMKTSPGYGYYPYTEESDPDFRPGDERQVWMNRASLPMKYYYPQKKEDEAIDIQETIDDDLTNLKDPFVPEKLTILDEQRSGPVIESEEDEEEIVSEGIIGPNRWQKFLSKITRQPYRAATRGVYGYSPVELNKMNAMGGFYSEPMRQYRRDMGRIGNMLNRQAQGKKIGETNLKNLINQYGGQGGISREDLNVIGQKAFTGPGQAFEARPSGTFTTPSGEKGYSGGRATGGYIRSGYSKGGRVGILSIL